MDYNNMILKRIWWKRNIQSWDVYKIMINYAEVVATKTQDGTVKFWCITVVLKLDKVHVKLNFGMVGCLWRTRPNPVDPIPIPSHIHSRRVFNFSDCTFLLSIIIYPPLLCQSYLWHDVPGRGRSCCCSTINTETVRCVFVCGSVD